MLVASAQLSTGIVRDVRISDGRVTEIAERLRPRAGEDGIDARGGSLIPGLHDHHVHLLSQAAASLSVAVGPGDVTAGSLGARLQAAPGRGWIRAIDYHESVAGHLDRGALDRIVSDRPLRVQHRNGSLWTLNSAAIEAIGLTSWEADGVERDTAGVPTGRIWRLDARLREAIPPPELDLAPLSALAARRGVTGFTDATPYVSLDELDRLGAAVASGELQQRVWTMAEEVDPRLQSGPSKIVLDESRLPTLDDLANRIQSVHARGRAAAIHCVTYVELWLALAAYELAGTVRGDRIEHASVTPPDALRAIRRLHLTVVTQPNFIFERGDDYIEDVDPEDLPFLYRLRAFRECSIPVAAGTDAPFGSPNPWVAIAAACTRQTRSGRTLGAQEALDGSSALALFLGGPGEPGRPRRVAPGRRDIVLLREPLENVLAEPDATQVAATWVDGLLVFAD
jgi:predicted amidohydrolase YtcJ